MNSSNPYRPFAVFFSISGMFILAWVDWRIFVGLFIWSFGQDLAEKARDLENRSGMEKVLEKLKQS